MSDTPRDEPPGEAAYEGSGEPGAALAASRRAAWLENREHGTILGIRFIVALCDLLGRRAARAFIHVLMLYYTAFATKARRASRAWLTHALGRPATLREVYRHLTTFALVALDRVFFLRGRSDLFELRSHGTEHLRALADAQRGAILLGGHVGSFEAMRAQAKGRSYDVHMLAYLENAKKITRVFAALAPEMQAKVIELGSVASLLRAREVVEGGSMLAILGDRTGLNEKTTNVEFGGRPAPLPTGPYLLAHALRCPVLLVFGIYRGGNRYDLYCEPFAERIELPRKTRQAALAAYAQAYAKRLEHYAAESPFNWFNIYDFWNP